MENSDEFIIAVLDKDQYDCMYEASHCMIYAEDNSQFQTTDRNGVLQHCYDHKFAIMMQMRFDGYLGFPGGIVDKGETALDAVIRELQEEMNFDPKRFTIKEDNLVAKYFLKSAKLFLYFYALKIPMQDLIKLEREIHETHDWGNEVLGYCRVPLYTMKDGYRGFPAFLKNNFISCSKSQLLYAIEHLKIMTKTEIANALKATPNTSYDCCK